MSTEQRMSAAELHSNLAQFCGSEEYHQIRLSRMRFTDGVAYLAEHGFALWLVTAIASYQGEKHVKNVPFQLWTLTPAPAQSAVLTMKEDTNEPELVRQEIDHTDFPFDEGKPFKLYVIDGICLLPQEY